MQTTVRPHDSIRLVSIDVGDAILEGELALPSGPRGIVLVLHGTGGSRLSPRTKNVARALREAARVGTLLCDLLTDRESEIDAATATLRFDLDLLTRRVIAATDWVLRSDDTGELSIGYFGASTGAAAALVAAAQRPDDVDAIATRSGRPDLVDAAVLARVRAPTMFIVGGEDHLLLEANRQATAHMRAPVKLEVVSGAGHSFEEPGALGDVAHRASKWFERWLRGSLPNEG